MLKPPKCRTSAALGRKEAKVTEAFNCCLRK